ncbi:MAG: serine hydroxymethyltransferase [Thermodesulfobacteriota bacterium]|nr:serine hydroxymethyltransferase [Deltaproteobacteria bacterium TMED58]RZP15853.1 MAG: serine hydroxymethyltransferase [Candidatus Dadabacteria bacterium]|tara:strand:- start:10658 stop:11902 length:1245 start_codon:yes stop_codon:yes gene_type:complete
MTPTNLIDNEVSSLINDEIKRQEFELQMIASENYASQAVMEVMGSVLTNKYAEGYPGKRYYGGCQFVDIAEELAIKRAKKLFGAEAVNVQPHSGAQANMAVFLGFLEPGDTVLGMSLDHGGHLSHGSKVNFSGRIYNSISYGVDEKTFLIDYDQIEELAIKNKPKIIIAGWSSYPRDLDYKRFREIADKSGSLLLADIAHPSGLIAAGLYSNPIPFCDFVTTTTHKTLRGPRGGMIMTKEEHLKIINSRVFPGTQGGPLMNTIAAKAVAFNEALSDSFKDYQKQVLANSRLLAKILIDKGFNCITGGTDTHLVLLDLRGSGVTGKEGEAALASAGITTNKNAIPFDPLPPSVASGIRIGTPGITTRGMKEDEVRQIGELISKVLLNYDNEALLETCKKEVNDLCVRFPIYTNLL